MARLPTVKLRHKSTGQIRKMNALDYAGDIGRWKDWVIFHQEGGDAPREEVEHARTEQIIEENRKRDPAREKRFGDKERQQKDRAVKTGAATAAAKVPEYKSKKFAEMRQIVHSHTGTYPKTKADAARLMGD